jgi:hypothetical protein
MTPSELEKRVTELEKTVAGLKPQSSLYAAFTFAAEQLLLWSLCFGLFVFFVPPLDRLFNDFNVAMPRATKSVLGKAQWVRDNWIIFSAGLVLIFGTGVMVVALLHSRRRSLSRAFVFLLNLIPLLLIAYLVVVIGMPLVKLLRALAEMPP